MNVITITYNTEQIGGTVVNSLYLQKELGEDLLQAYEVGPYFKVKIPVSAAEKYAKSVKGTKLEIAVKIDREVVSF